MNQQLNSILQLSVYERMSMVEAIWDSIAAEAKEAEFSDSHKAMLDKSLKDHRDNPSGGDSWENVKERIKSRLK